MSKLLLLCACLAGSLCAAEMNGIWTGTREVDGHPRRVTLWLVQHGPNFHGSIIHQGDARSGQLENQELRGDQLTFQVRETADRVVQYRLTTSPTGILTGEATAEGRTGKVMLTQRSERASGLLNNRVAPALIHKVEPEYTAEARAQKLQGTVSLSVEIQPDGSARVLNVIRGLGLGLDEKAIECVETWGFTPAIRNGEPVKTMATIEVNFRLLDHKE